MAVVFSLDIIRLTQLDGRPFTLPLLLAQILALDSLPMLSGGIRIGHQKNSGANDAQYNGDEHIGHYDSPESLQYSSLS